MSAEPHDRSSDESAQDPAAASPDLAGEALRLVEALRDAASSWAGSGGSRPDGSGAAERHAADCAWCPLCQGVSRLREAQPEIARHLAGAATAVAAALCAMAADLDPGRRDATRTAAPQSPEPPGSTPPPSTQRPAPPERPPPVRIEVSE